MNGTKETVNRPCDNGTERQQRRRRRGGGDTPPSNGEGAAPSQEGAPANRNGATDVGVDDVHRRELGGAVTLAASEPARPNAARASGR